MFPQHGAETGFRVRDAPEAQREPRHPQSCRDIGGIDRDDLDEEPDRVGGPSGARELLSAPPIGRRRLGPGGQHERGGEQSQHVGA